MLSCQLAVIGAGSAGCGAALAASRLGIDTVLVENYPRIGGISTFAGVNCYEPVAGATGISRLLFEEMRRNDPAGIGIYRMARHCAVPAGDEPPFPGAEQRINPAGRYEDTLCSHVEEREPRKAFLLRSGVIFEPELFCRTVEGMLAGSGCCRIRTGVAPAALDCRDGVLRRMVLTDGTRLEAARWIDCSGAVAAQCGCRMLFGREASGRFGESGAPKFPEPVLNGVSQIFRIRPGGRRRGGAASRRNSRRVLVGGTVPGCLLHGVSEWGFQLQYAADHERIGILCARNRCGAGGIETAGLCVLALFADGISGVPAFPAAPYFSGVRAAATAIACCAAAC